MSEHLLRAELTRVTLRYRMLYRSVALVLLWVVLAFCSLAALRFLRGLDFHPPLWGAAAVAVVGVLITPILLLAARRAANPLWLARRIEKKFPDLDARLLAALEQHPEKGADLGFLQQMVINQAVIHARKNVWASLVPSSLVGSARVLNGLACMSFVGITVFAGLMWASMWASNRTIPPQPKLVQAVPNFTIKVEPEDATIERGTALLVMARFGVERVPGEVELLYRDGDNAPQTIGMSKSLDDPLFAIRVPAVKRDGSYAIRYGSEETRWYKISVFDYPALKQADADIHYPPFTGQDPKIVKDTRSVSGVEGTNVQFTFHVNKPLTDARLIPTRRPVDPNATQPARGGRGGRGAVAAAPATQPAIPSVPVTLTVDPKDATAYTLTMDLKYSQVYRVELVDADKRSNRDQAQMTINVTANRPPELRIVSPTRDLDVSALEEITVRAQVYDDYGVKRAGITYSLAGQTPRDLILAENVPAKQRRDVSQVISLEKLGAQVDQLLSYHVWAEDIGPDGKVRRTQGDMKFADVRPFEEIYRQGEALAQGEEDQQQQQQQRQQQQQGQQGNQNTQRADQIANTLKQVIAATWNIQRRETGDTLSEQFVPDVTNVENSQSRIKDQTQGMGDQVSDDRAQAFLDSSLKNMDGALEKLKAAETTPSASPLTDAVNFEQAAYQDLLKLRAREFEVTRSNRQQGQQQTASNQRRQQQLQQMNLQQQQNPYQSRRNAQQQQQQQQDPQQAQQESEDARETRQMLSRLNDLAQRQNDLNRQMQELQSALQQAQDPAQREEIQRQLANLRDQQQQQLRDTDDLRDRMDQAQNQEQTADARQKLQGEEVGRRAMTTVVR